MITLIVESCISLSAGSSDAIVFVFDGLGHMGPAGSPQTGYFRRSGGSHVKDVGARGCHLEGRTFNPATLGDPKILRL